MKGDAALGTALRSHMCGALRPQHAGCQVSLGGWVHRTRNLGGLIFVDLRDREGIVQVSFDPRYADTSSIAVAEGLTPESVILVQGEVVQRPPDGRNPELATGDVEVRARSARIVGPAVTPAIPVARTKNDKLPAEELRLKYRLLDLRRGEMAANIMLRHRLLQRARRTLSDAGFLEIETPILTKPTPEGARDYLVPSRIHAGEFYALPQSPQIYKQLLMVAGFDRYFQIARCFRDEDLRADRQPEFTQIDVEASFVGVEDVYAIVERILVDQWDEAGESVSAPFPRLSYRDAIERYGVDKPDLRFEFIIRDLTSTIGDDAAPFVREQIAAGGRVRGIVAPNAAGVSRKELDALSDAVKGAKAGGLIWARRTSENWEGQGVKAIGASALANLGGSAGDLLLAIAAADTVSSPALHLVRSSLVRRPGVQPGMAHAFVWIVDFPLFELEPESGSYVPSHHPFTAPHPDDFAILESDPARCRALHYDAVYNGNELGSGSIRITDATLQRTIFRLLGISAEDQMRRFGFLLDGLAAGAPPMGGFALGFDRIAMLLAGASSLREVIAFPKTTAARALFEGAPTPVNAADLLALHLTRASRGGAT